TLLIDAAWWDEVREKVSGEILACVPARNIVLIGGTGRPETLPQMRDAARKIEAGGDHLISGTILIRRGGNWEVHRDTTDPPVSGGPPPAGKPPSAPSAPPESPAAKR